MPFIDGETLRSKLDRETQLGIDEAVKITTEVADALDYAHRHGVIHRDIKPENILLHDGRPMVADFGIALAVSAAAGGRMTETGLSLGTPHYMSPEQATAEKELTPRSDVYSLGSVLYEMLTGNPPHTGATAQQIIMKIVTEEAAPVTTLRKSVPPNVAAAVAQAVERLPADRFESAKGFGDALRDRNFSTTTGPTARAAAGASPWHLALVGGLLAGAAAGAVAMALWRPAPPARGEINRDQLTFSGQARRPAISPDGRRVAYIVDACTPAEVDCRVSLEVLEVGATRAQVLIPAARGLWSPRWSHDGETVVVGGAIDQGQGGIFAVPRLNATPRLIYEGPWRGYDTHPAADSVLVLAGAEDSMSVISMVDGTRHATFPVTLGKVDDIAWSPAGTRIAVKDGTGLHVLDRNGRALGTISGGAARDWVRWTTSGNALLYFRTGRAREDELVRRGVNGAGALSEGAEVIMPRTTTLYAGELDVARKSGAIAIRTGDAITDLWSFEVDQRPVASAQETHGTTWYGDPVVSLDGRLLYYYRGDALGDNIYRLDRVTGVEEALTAELGPGANQVMLSSDGTRLGYARVRDSGQLLEQMDVTTRRVSSGRAPITQTVVPVTPRGFLTESPQGALSYLDSLGGAPRSLTDPDSVAILSFAVTSDGLSAVFAAIQFPTVGSPQTRFIGKVALQGGAMTRLTTLTGPVGAVPGVSVGSNGTVFVSQWIPGEPQPSLWRMPATGGTLARFADIPVACEPRSLVVGWNGRTATCGVDDFRGDIWLVNLGQATR
jgi:hypothetical protein